jgi:hypothetical protein
MPPSVPPRKPTLRRLTPVEVLQRLQFRIEKRMDALQRLKLDGYDVVLAELNVELDLLRRAARYLAESNRPGTR